MWANGTFLLVGLIAGMAAVAAVERLRRSRLRWLSTELQDFFGVVDASQIEVKDRSFTAHAAPDVKLGLDQWLASRQQQVRLIGVPIADSFMTQTSIGTLLAPRGEEYYRPTSVEYETYDVGDDQIVECPRHALWFVSTQSAKLAILWTSTTSHGRGGFSTKLRIEVGYAAASPPR